MIKFNVKMAFFKLENVIFSIELMLLRAHVQKPSNSLSA